MYQRSRTSWTKHIDFMLLDAITLFFAFWFGYRLRFDTPFKSMGKDAEYIKICILFIVFQILMSLMINNLSGVLRRGYIKEFISVAVLAFATFASTAVYMYAFKLAEKYSRLQFFYSIIIFLVADFILRILLKKIVLARKQNSQASHKSLLIVCSEKMAGDIVSDILKNNLEGFAIRGLVFADEEYTPEKEIMGIPVVCALSDAADYVCREWIDEIYIYRMSPTETLGLFESACAEMGVTVHTGITLKNISTGKQFIETVGGHTVLTTAYNYVSAGQATVKRLMDIAGGLVGSLIAVVIIVLVGPFIFIKSPGPVIFKQKRVGKNGKIFKMYKLRSMYLDAEERKKDYLDQNRVGDGMMFKLDFDPRIIGNKVLEDGTKKTGIGEFIRKTSLDEFPQFFNVLKGDMSLVGTRPPTVDEWEKYEYHHRARLAMKPGITGMWQVSGRSDIRDFEEVVKLDTDYISQFSIILDIKILFKTVAVLFSHKGAM